MIELKGEERRIYEAEYYRQKGVSGAIRPGDIFEATAETKLGHSTPQGYRVLILSNEGAVFEGSKIWDVVIVREHKTGMRSGHQTTEEALIKRFLYVGNLYEMLGNREVIY